MNKNNIVIGILVVTLIGAAFYIGMVSTELKLMKENGFSGNAETFDVGEDFDVEALAANVAPIGESDHVRGNRDAKITLVEYSDYECPYCSSFHETGKQAVEFYGDQLSWVYRHFPLDSIHPVARPAAYASECVAEFVGEDAFWTVTDMFFEVDSLAKESVKEMALTLGISESDYDTCIASESIKNKIETDLQSGFEAGVQGTPGNILLNNETGEVTVLPGAVPFEYVQEAVDTMLAQ